MTAPTTAMESHTLNVPGATLTYDVRTSEGTTEPPLVLIEGREGPFELAVRLLDHRADLGERIRGRSDPERLRGIHELAGESPGASDGADEDREGCRRALLAGMAERALDDIARGEVEVGGRHDDHRVLAAGLDRKSVV